jgi:outer membrane protein TolC
MNSHPYRRFWLAVLMLLGGLAASAQEPLTLRQAVDRALRQNPEAAVARADSKAASAEVSLARTQLLPKLNFTEDISRGNDPVYAFGTRLRQQRFTQADFAPNALNRPEPIGNFSTRFSGSWLGFVGEGGGSTDCASGGSSVSVCALCAAGNRCCRA